MMKKITKHMARVFAAAACAGALVLTGCHGDLENDIADLQQRVETLEDITQQLQDQLDNGAMISNVESTANGWKISFAGGTVPSIEIKHGDKGTAGNHGVTPMLKVEPLDGKTMLWVSYDGGETYTHTGVDLKGPQGDVGVPGTGTPGDVGPDGPAGTPGADAITPKFKIDENDEGNLVLWHNVTEEYPEEGWVEVPVEVDEDIVGVAAYVDNAAEGTVTFLMSDGEEFTFPKFSSAVHFEIMNVTLNFAQVGTTMADVLFRVNPSTATVPTDVSKWTLDEVATRASYINESAAFSLQGIAPSGGTGQYVATIEYTAYDTAVEEYVLALVLNNGTVAEPILISSAPFGLKEVPAPTLNTESVSTQGTISIDHNDPLVVNRTVTLTAEPKPDYLFSEWVLTLDGESIEITELNNLTGNANSAEISFWMPNGNLVAEAIFIADATADAITKGPETNGTFTVSNTGALSGSEITLTAAPAAGYYLQSYTVTGDVSSDPVTVTLDTSAGNVANEAFFFMPNEAVTVTAVFAPLAEVDPTFATINGVVWAKANVDAPGVFAGAAENFGLYYQFNSATGWDAAGTSTPAAQTWSTAQTSVAWDMTANNPCPSGYVVPTEAQMESLIDRTAVSLQAETVNSVDGYRFVDRATGENIFLPGASNKINQNSVANSTNGNYWTASNATNGMGDEYVYRLYFYAAQVRVPADTQASTARSVRCVAE